MSLWCNECASRVYVRKGCPKCGPMAGIDSVPPIRGYVWMRVGADVPERAFGRGMRREQAPAREDGD